MGRRDSSHVHRIPPLSRITTDGNSSLLVYYSAAFQSLSLEVQAIRLNDRRSTPMLRKSLLVFTVMCTAILIGCSKTETTNNSNSVATDGNKNTSATTTTTTTTKTTTSSDEKIGIAECDDFIAKYDACVSSKVPEMVRGPFKNALADWRKQWKKLAEDPANKEQLTKACKQAAEQQAAALKSYGCTF